MAQRLSNRLSLRNYLASYRKKNTPLPRVPDPNRPPTYFELQKKPSKAPRLGLGKRQPSQDSENEETYSEIPGDYEKLQRGGNDNTQNDCKQEDYTSLGPRKDKRPSTDYTPLKHALGEKPPLDEVDFKGSARGPLNQKDTFKSHRKREPKVIPLHLGILLGLICIILLISTVVSLGLFLREKYNCSRSSTTAPGEQSGSSGQHGGPKHPEDKEDEHDVLKTRDTIYRVVDIPGEAGRINIKAYPLDYCDVIIVNITSCPTVRPVIELWDKKQEVIGFTLFGNQIDMYVKNSFRINANPEKNLDCKIPYSFWVKWSGGFTSIGNGLEVGENPLLREETSFLRIGGIHQAKFRIQEKGMATFLVYKPFSHSGATLNEIVAYLEPERKPVPTSNAMITDGDENTCKRAWPFKTNHLQFKMPLLYPEQAVNRGYTMYITTGKLDCEKIEAMVQMEVRTAHLHHCKLQNFKSRPLNRIRCDFKCNCGSNCNGKILINLYGHNLEVCEISVLTNT